MPVKVYDAEFNETPWDDGPTVVVEFGPGDTRVQRVRVDGRIDFRFYTAPVLPPGTITPPGPGNGCVGRPSAVLSFPNEVTARLVLDYMLAELTTARGEVAPAIAADPRYIKPGESR